MTNKPEVTQADRETYAELFNPFPDEYSRVMAGECDDYDEIQIIARHREQSTAALQAENARLRERAARMDEALQEIEYLTTNAGGWFDQPGRQFAEYVRLGDIAKTAHTGD